MPDLSNLVISDETESSVNLYNIQDMIQSKSSAHYMYALGISMDRASKAPSIMSKVSQSVRSSFKHPKPSSLASVSRSVENPNRVKAFYVSDEPIPTVINVIEPDEIVEYTGAGDAKQIMTDSCFSRSSMSSVHQQ